MMVTYRKPTKDDAELLIRLLEMNNDNPQMEKAMKWFDKDLDAKTYAEFKEKYPEGSEGNQYLNMIVGNYELAGVLVSHGLLNENLYFDMSPIGFIWEKVSPIVEGARKEMSAQLWENAAWLAERQKRWLKTVWKPNLAWKKLRPGS